MWHFMTTKSEWLTGAIIVVLVIGAVLGVLILLSKIPKCLRGHNQPRWVPEYCYAVPHEFGTRDNPITIWMNQCDPPHWTSDFICDEYEVEKMPK
jgi:hypothetical protein